MAVPVNLTAREQALTQVAAAIASGDLDMATMSWRAAAAAGVPDAVLETVAEHVARILQDAGSWPLMSPSVATVELADHSFPLFRSGTGLPVVVLHPLGLDWRVGQVLAGELGNQVETMSYDMRSHGASTAPPDSFSLERCADDLVGLLDLLGLEQANVVGFSLGGAVAQLASLRSPARIRSLMLVCSMAAAKRDQYLARAAAAEETRSTAAEIIPTMRRWFSDDALAGNPWYVRYARGRVRACSARDWSYWWRRFSEFDIHNDLGGITCPTSVLAGERDASSSPTELRTVASRMGARFEVAPGGSHMLVLEQPRFVAQRVMAHLAWVSGRPAVGVGTKL